MDTLIQYTCASCGKAAAQTVKSSLPIRLSTEAQERASKSCVYIVNCPHCGKENRVRE